MKTAILLSGILLLLGTSCGNRNPNLSKEALLTELNREVEKPKVVPVIPEGYVPPAGIKYTAKRDLSEPLVRLDVIAGLKNERQVKLSEFGKEIVYYRIGEFEYGIRLPLIPVEGGYLIGAMDGVWLLNESFKKDRMLIRNDAEMQNSGNFRMFRPNKVVKSFCYDPAVRALFCLLYEVFEEQKSSQHYVAPVAFEELVGSPDPVEVVNITNRVKLGHASDIYQVKDGFAIGSYYLRGLYTFDAKGDTMARFEAGSDPYEAIKGTTRGADDSNTYIFKGCTYYRQAYTDTVFRLKDVSSFQPVYKIDMGAYRVSRSEGMSVSFDLSEKYLVNTFTETDDLVFLGITQNYECPATRENKTVKFYQLIYDKRSKQLYSFADRKDLSKPGLIENDLDAGIGFWPQTQIDGKPYMQINGEALKKELPKEKLDRIPALQGLTDDEIILITIK